MGGDAQEGINKACYDPGEIEINPRRLSIDLARRQKDGDKDDRTAYPCKSVYRNEGCNERLG